MRKKSPDEPHSPTGARTTRSSRPPRPRKTKPPAGPGYSHDLMSYVIEHNRSAVAVHDKDLKFIYVSQRYLDDLRVREPDVIGKHLYDVFPDLPQRWKAVHQRVLNGEVLSADDDPFLRADGSLDWTRWECRPWYAADGSIGGMIVYTEVVNQRKQAEEALYAAKTRLDSIINVSPLPILMLDRDDRIQLWNPAAEATFGWSAAEALGMPNPIIPAARVDEYDRWKQQILNGLPLTNQETVRQRKDGSLIDVSISSAPMFNSSGALEGRMAIFADITERKRHAQELEAIATLSAALRRAGSRAEMLPVIVEQITGLFEADASTIEIIDPQTGDAVVEAAHGLWTLLIGKRQPQGTGLNAVISQALQPYYCNDLEKGPVPFYYDWARQGMRGCVGVALSAQEQRIGFIWMGKKTPLAKNDVQLLSSVANIAANAIHRATLHEQTQKDAAELAHAYDTTLEGWAHALELRDRETEGHTRRLVDLTIRLARIMGVSEARLEDIRRGVLLHDIGKMGIPDSVLLKPGSLDEREWETMRRHPEYARTLLSQIAYLQSAINIPYCHHEKWDGSGYPHGLAGEAIPLEARIFAIVDVWDALTNDRPYRLAWPEDEAENYIRRESGRHFDPAVVQAFFEMLGPGWRLER